MNIENQITIKKQKIYVLVYVLSALAVVKFNFIEPGQAVTDIFFSNRNDSGMDFFNPVVFASTSLENMFKNMDGITYPGLAVVFFRFLYKSIPYDLISSCNGDVLILRGNQFLFIEYVLCVIVAIIGTAILIQKIIRRYIGEDGVISFVYVVTLSYGMIYGIERGNVIILMPMLILFFLYYKDDSRWYVRELALVSIAVATGFKIYPAFWGILLLVDRRIWDSIRTIIYGVICLVGPMIYFGGVDSIYKWIKNLTGFNEIAGDISDLAGCGAVQISRTFCFLFKIDNGVATNVYSFVGKMQLLICVLLFVGVWVLKKDWEKYLSIVLLMIFFPRWSNDYCYLYFMIPFVFLICDKKWERKNNFFYVISMMVLVIYLLPKIITFDNQNYAFEVSDMLRQLAVLVTLIIISYSIIKECIIILYKKRNS